MLRAGAIFEVALTLIVIELLFSLFNVSFTHIVMLCTAVLQVIFVMFAQVPPDPRDKFTKKESLEYQQESIKLKLSKKVKLISIKLSVVFVKFCSGNVMFKLGGDISIVKLIVEKFTFPAESFA